MCEDLKLEDNARKIFRYAFFHMKALNIKEDLIFREDIPERIYGFGYTEATFENPINNIFIQEYIHDESRGAHMYVNTESNENITAYELYTFIFFDANVVDSKIDLLGLV